MRKLPRYALAGFAAMVISEVGMLAGVEPFASFHTPIAWTGYILFVDGLVWRWRADSWLQNAPAELLFLAVFSVPLWLVFEFYNLWIQNWHYVGLPGNPWVRLLGYGWSFATIWPAIFETGELVSAIRDLRAPPGRRVERPCPSSLTGRQRASIVVGLVMLALPLAWPSPYLAAPVFLGFIFLLDPINARLGGRTLCCDFGYGRFRRAENLAVAGLVCGVLWEFWNYWARSRWVYTVPILSDWKLFEMPLAGYLGFPAFALECFTMYVTVRCLLWHGEARTIAI
jgi:hypothetical protein